MKQKDAVKTYIKKQIMEGSLIPGQYAPSERAICKILTVSRVTARNALNELVEEKLLINLPKKGYLLPKVNHNTKSKNVKNNILFIHEHEDEEFLKDPQHNEIWKGAREIAVQNGYNIKITSLFPSNINNKTIKEFKEEYAGVVCDINHKDFLDDVLQQNIPLVQIHGALENLNTTKIVQSDFEGAYQGTRFLIEKTNQKVGIIEFSAGLKEMNKTYHNDRRLAGWQLAHLKKNLKINQNDIISDNYISPNYLKIAKKMMGSELSTYFLPFGHFYQGIQLELNKFPAKEKRQFTWVTWGKPPESKQYLPPAAYLQWDFKTMGKEGTNEVIKIIKTGIREEKTILIPVNLVINQ